MKRLLLALTISINLTACSNLVAVGTAIAVNQGAISQSQAASLSHVASATEKAFADITPEQEYYIGRTVAATITNRYPVESHPKENRYLTLVGNTLILASDTPENYVQYRFLILETDEINAFAAPGGFIFISKGMLDLCQNEDDLAAVLAHEIGHILHAHALQSIETSRLTSALTTLAVEGAKHSGQQMATLSEAFGGSVDDITQTLINSGYGRSLENEADASAVMLLQQSGYDANGLLRVLQRMKTKTAKDPRGFAATHPDMEARIMDIKRLIRKQATNPLSALRTARFRKLMRNI